MMAELSYSLSFYVNFFFTFFARLKFSGEIVENGQEKAQYDVDAGLKIETTLPYRKDLLPESLLLNKLFLISQYIESSCC